MSLAGMSEMALSQDRCGLVGLLGLEQDIRAGDDRPGVSRVHFEHVIKLRKGRRIFALLAIEVGAANSLVVAGRVLGVVQDGGDLSLGQRPLAFGDIGGDQLPAVVPRERALLVAALELLEPANRVVERSGAKREIGQRRLGRGQERRARIELFDRFVADDGFERFRRLRPTDPVWPSS